MVRQIESLISKSAVEDSAPLSRTLQLHLPSTQKVRRVEASGRLQHPQPAPAVTTLPDGDDSLHHAHPDTRTLGDLHRSQGRNLPCMYRSPEATDVIYG